MIETLTDDIIKADIAEYKQRITKAREKLSELPTPTISWKERKKLLTKRGILETEIVHVQHLIEIATAALEEA